MMSDLSIVSGNEVALVRLQSGRRVLMMGTPGAVNIGPFSKRVIDSSELRAIHMQARGLISSTPGAESGQSHYSRCS